MLIYFFIYEIWEQTACKIFVIRDTMSFLVTNELNIFPYSFLGTLSRLKKDNNNHEMIMQRRDVYVQISLGRNCPDTDV